MIYTLLRRYLLTGAVFFALALPAHGQLGTESASIATPFDPGVEAEGEEAAPEEDADAVDFSEEPIIRSGDQLHLKSGQTLSDVQILRSTPRFYEVQFIDGLTMEVPRTQVESVSWDEIDPLDIRRNQVATPETSTDNAVQGMEVGPELKEKLGLPVTDSPLVYIDEDIIVILENLTRRQGVAFEVDESVRSLPIEERTLRLEINSTLTFADLFLDRLPAALPGLVVVYEQDKVRLVTRAVAQQQQAPRPGAASAVVQQTPPMTAQTPTPAAAGEPPSDVSQTPAEVLSGEPIVIEAPPVTPDAQTPQAPGAGTETSR